jgi:hypothetical protein
MRQYRDTVTIQTMDAADGTATPSYSTTFMEDVPCSIFVRGGDETYKGRILEGHLTHVVEMQWLDGLLPSMRLYVTSGVNAGKYLNIAYIRPLEGGGRARKAELQCVSTEAA